MNLTRKELTWERLRGYWPDGDPSLVSGLTEDEQQVMDYVVAAWNAFGSLPEQRVDHLAQVRCAVHKIQQVLALRIVRRNYSEYWGELE